MSGGVDSLMTALLLKEQGVEVWGIHMIVGEPSNAEGYTDSYSNRFKKTREVLDRIEENLQLEIRTVDFRQVFEKTIIKPFVDSYLDGLTPNPCVVCNAKIKFGILLEKALSLGARSFATGHYVRISWDSVSKRWQLLRGIDKDKEQSYFLHQLTQDQLEHAVFPLGNRTKKEVYELIGKLNMGNVPSRESHEICFIPDNDYKNFIRKRVGIEDIAGELVDQKGTVLGKHRGIFRYTVGQRRGIGIPSSEPYYVVSIDPKTNRVQIGRKADLYARRLVVSGINWVSISPPTKRIKADTQIRYRHRPVSASIEVVEKDRALVEFDTPQKAITPGQYAVFYDHDLLLGGGQITEALR